MYCVKCGVRLQEGVNRCPLCGTPVWNPEGVEAENTYSERLPQHTRESTLPAAVALSILCVIAEAVVLTVCLHLYGELQWGVYAMGGIALFAVMLVLPLWFRRPNPEVFIPVNHAACALFLLMICLETGGSWFLSFAFPVTGISCLLSTALVCLLRHVKQGRTFIFGGFLLLLGGFTVLIEFFEHITFAAPMFLWSLYSLVGFGAAGLFLLITGIIPSLRAVMEKLFFF